MAMKLKEVVQGLQIPPTANRVEKHTLKKINQAIKQRTIYYISVYKNASYDALTCRLDELEHEWDTERTLELSDALLLIGTSILGLSTRKSIWFALCGIIGFSLASHALQGWSIEQQAIRSAGVRTPSEIYIEKTAIKFVRGDFSRSTDIPAEIYNIAAKNSSTIY